MTYFLDTLPFNFSRQSAQELLATRSDSYYVETPVHRLVQKLGVVPATIAWGQPMSEVWANVQQPERHIYCAAPRSGEDCSLSCYSGCCWSVQGSLQVRLW